MSGDIQPAVYSSTTSRTYMLVTSLASGDVLVLETDTLQTRRTFTTPRDIQNETMVHCAVASHSGDVMIRKDTHVSFSAWDLVTGTCIQNFASDLPGFGEIGPLTLTHDGTRAATAHRSRASVGMCIVVTWDVASGDVLHLFENYVNLPMALSFSPNKSFLVCTDFGGECSEFCLTGALFITRNIRREGAPENEMRAVVWEPDSNKYICGHVDGSVITVESAGSTLQVQADLTPAPLSYFAYSSRGDSVAALAMSVDGSLLAIAGGRLIHECDDKSTGKSRVSGFVSVYQTSNVGGNTQVSRDWYKHLLWKYSAIPEHHGSVFSVSFSLDSKLLASGGVDRICRVWNALDGIIVNQINMSHIITDLFFVFDIEEQRNRRLAFAMGGHESLGIDSILSVLSTDLLNKLIDFI